MGEMAFVFINTEAGKEKVVYKALEDMSDVTPHMVYGKYDLVAEVRAPDIDRLRRTVGKIREKNVISTLTEIVIKSYRNHDEKPETASAKPTS